MDITALAAALISIVLCVTTHEVAHGWVASLYGDPTARDQGRLTLNPIKHIDPVFTIIVPMVLYLTVGVAFGGAKPVPVNPNYFRTGTNIKRALLWVAAAGPISNFLQAFIAALGMQLMFKLGKPGITDNFFYLFFRFSLLWNVVLGLFNLIPIPPLDGAKVLAGLLPNSMANLIYKAERFALIFIALIFLLFYMRLLDISAPIYWVFNLYETIARTLVGVIP